MELGGILPGTAIPSASFRGDATHAKTTRIAYVAARRHLEIFV